MSKGDLSNHVRANPKLTAERLREAAEFEPDHNGDGLPGEEKHLEFPLQCFPKVAQAVIKEVARANKVPEPLVACSVLGIASASLGGGIRVVSGPLRHARGNLFVTAIAATGVGKDSAFRRVMTPFAEVEERITTQWTADMGAVLAEIGMRERECERYMKEGARADDTATKEVSLRMAAEARTKADELKKRAAEPRLSVADVTKEKLGVIMSEQAGEAIASISAEARGIVDVLCGRYSEGSSDEDFYTAGFSGTPVKVDRQSRGRVYLREPCLTLLWMLQPDKFRDLLDKENITESGLLQRCLICDTHAEPKKEEDVEINFDLFTGWDSCIQRLVSDYRFRNEPITIEPSPEAKKVLRDYFNELVDRRCTGGDLHDVNGYAARWAEQAWHVAVIWHAINEGKAAPQRKLSQVNAEAAIKLVRWFAQEQLSVLAAMRSQRQQMRMEKLAEILQSHPDDRSTLRDLGRCHGFDEGEVRALADEYPHRVDVVVTSPKTGRPSTLVILKR
jgi:hypothetical protein